MSHIYEKCLLHKNNYTLLKVNNHENEEIETAAVEDLMREHGILNRILLIYSEFINIYNKFKYFKISHYDIIYNTASMIRIFIEDYHERMEENYIFSLFIKKEQYVNLVNELYKQHQLGRILTDKILYYSSQSLHTNDNINKMINCMQLFIKMYRIHEAREDTILFPAFKKIVPKKEYDELGKKFEQIEEKMFGKGGFEKNISKIEEIEKKLNIYDIAKPSDSIMKYLKLINQNIIYCT